MTAPAPLGGFRALALGVRALRRNLSVLGFAVVGEGAVAACRAALLFSAAIALVLRLGAGSPARLGPDLFLPLIGEWIVLELLGALLRAVSQSALVVNASSTLVEPANPPLPILSAASQVLPRAVVASIWLGLLDVGIGLIRTVVLASAAIVVVHGFTSGGGLGASLVGALGVALAAMAALLLALFSRAYRVIALRRLELTAHASMVDAWALLGRRLSTVLLLEVIGAALAVGGALVAAGPGGLATALGSKHAAVGLSLRVIAAVMAAAWSVAVDLALLGAVCAIDLDEKGQLPRPPAPAQPVLIAEPVLVAQAIDPEPSAGS